MGPLVDHHNRPISLGKKLGSGGEGAVFELNRAGTPNGELAGASEWVAKIYHAPPAAEKVEKLRAMVSLAAPQVTKFASWPVATVHDRSGGAIVGVLIPRVRDHQEVHNLYSPAHRKLKFPRADWHFLAHVAMNCASAFEALHSAGHIIGDVNQGNVLASHRGTIFLIDCDSFQVQAAGRRFLCEVGVPQFTPPELQGRSFHGVERTRNHDCFGLAVLVFHLLFLGRHPYAGRFLGKGEMPIERAIAEYRYAFSGSAAKFQMAQPPHTLPLGDLVSDELAQLFERAFDRGSEAPNARPSAQEWRLSLEALIRSLQSCPVDRGHKFAQSLLDCPWCALVRGGAPNFFVSVTIQNANSALEQSGVIAAIWTEIQQIPLPSALPLPSDLSQPTVIVPRPLPENIEISRGFSSMLSTVSICAAVATLGGFISVFIAYISAAVCLVFSAWWLVVHLTSEFAVERKRRWRQLRDKRAERDTLRRVWNRCVKQLDNRFTSVKQELAKVVEQSQNLKPQFERELKAIERDRASQQLRMFLEGRFLAAYDIPQIGAGRKAVLLSYGIETAADINPALIQQIPGFGPALTTALVAWRTSMEQQFKFDPAQAVPPAVRQAVLTKYAQLRQQYELRLRDGANRLRKILEETHASGVTYLAQAAQKEEALRQAQADYDLLRSLK